MKYVVVGTGAAGTSAVEVLKKEDPDSEVVLIGEEPQPAYYRFHLPDVVGGKRTPEAILIHSSDYYQ